MTTDFSALLEALRRARLPGALINSLGLLYRYLFVLGDEGSRMMRARNSRHLGRILLREPAVLGGMVGTLWIRSYLRSVRVAHAMEARGGMGGRMLSAAAPVSIGGRMDSAGIGRNLLCCVDGAADGDGGTMSLLAVSDLRHTYPDGMAALCDVSFSLGEGERIALIGPHGAGKTTLLLRLAGLLWGEGSIALDGMQLAKGTIKRLRSKIGITFQNPDDQLFCPTILDDIAYGLLQMGLSDEIAREEEL